MGWVLGLQRVNKLFYFILFLRLMGWFGLCFVLLILFFFFLGWAGSRCWVFFLSLGFFGLRGLLEVVWLSWVG